jgi:hypothetical protein
MLLVPRHLPTHTHLLATTVPGGAAIAATTTTTRGATFELPATVEYLNAMVKTFSSALMPG